MRKGLTDLIWKTFLVGSIFGCAGKAVKTLSVDSSGEGLVEVKGKPYMRYNEDGVMFLENLGANARLIKSEDGIYDVAVERDSGMTYYDFERDGKFTQTYHPKDKDEEF